MSVNSQYLKTTPAFVSKMNGSLYVLYLKLHLSCLFLLKREVKKVNARRVIMKCYSFSIGSKWAIQTTQTIYLLNQIKQAAKRSSALH